MAVPTECSGYRFLRHQVAFGDRSSFRRLQDSVDTFQPGFRETLKALECFTIHISHKSPPRLATVSRNHLGVFLDVAGCESTRS
eukprot:4701858-Amphidinium_carterae.1